MICPYKASRDHKDLNNWIESESRTQCARILKDLKKKNWVPTAHFRIYAYQYNTRIKELRDGLYDGKNHVIISEKKDGICGFVYGGFTQRK